MIKNMETMVIIDDKIVSSEIFTECFACDYGTCGGACCIIGDSGAPMEEDEPERIEANYDKFSPLMSPEGRAVVAEKGFSRLTQTGIWSLRWCRAGRNAPMRPAMRKAIGSAR